MAVSRREHFDRGGPRATVGVKQLAPVAVAHHEHLAVAQQRGRDAIT